MDENNSHNNSDTDDWTLLSPPHSDSSSPEQEVLISPTTSSTSSSIEHINNDSEDDLNLNNNDNQKNREESALFEDDGLTEIDLTNNINQDQFRNNQTLSIIDENDDSQMNDENLQDTTRTSGSESSSMSGFHPMETTTDDDSVSNDSINYQTHTDCSNNGSRRSSLAESEFSDFVDFGKQTKCNLNTSIKEDAMKELNNSKQNILKKQRFSKAIKPKHHSIASIKNLQKTQSTSSSINKVNLIKSTLDELSVAVENAKNLKPIIKFDRTVQSRNTQYTVNKKNVMIICYLSFIVISLCILISIITDRISKNPSENRLHQRTSEKFDFSNILYNLKNIPTSQQYRELELLHNELSQCIKRQSPSSFKYYISDESISKLSSTSFSNNNDDQSKQNKKNLVCYGQELKWRKHFDKLKYEHNLDLSKLVSEVKRHLTNDVLKKYNQIFKFELILNQLRYLEFLENKREKKKIEETIKYLKSENLQLLRRVNEPNETGFQKLFVDLEIKNSQLIRENKALKASLIQKAGPIYIKQSNKIEELERENRLLKQFHNDVAKDISKSLKQFDLHTIEATTNLNDFVSLNSQLILTKNYLNKLGDKVSKILLENESLKEELKENHLLTTSLVNREVDVNNDDTTLYHLNQNKNLLNTNNNSNALIANSCMRNLANLEETSKLLKKELDELKIKLNKCSCNVNDLERSFGHHLNKTNFDYEQDKATSISSWERLGFGSQEQTAIDKHNKDAFSLKNDDIVDELMLFLTKFNNQIESNELAIVNHLQSGEAGYLNKLSHKLMENEIKVLPNYLRETYVQDKGKYPLKSNNLVKQSDDNDNGLYLKDIKLPLKPPTMLIDQYSPFGRSSNISDQLIIEHDLIHKKYFQNSDPMPTDHNRNNKTVYQQVQNSTLPIKKIKDSWFFRRAKQRKQLRQNYKDDFQTSWIYKRAKLREKLRKATFYIDENNYYIKANVGKEKDKMTGKPSLLNNGGKRQYQSSNKKSDQPYKNKQKQQKLNTINRNERQKVKDHNNEGFYSYTYRQNKNHHHHNNNYYNYQHKYDYHNEEL